MKTSQTLAEDYLLRGKSARYAIDRTSRPSIVTSSMISKMVANSGQERGVRSRKPRTILTAILLGSHTIGVKVKRYSSTCTFAQISGVAAVGATLLN